MIGYRSPKNSDIGPDIVVFYSDIGVKIDFVRHRLRYRTRYHRFLLRYQSFTKAYPFLPPLMSDPISEFAVISGEKTPISGPIFLLHPLLPPPMSANYGCHVRHRLRCEKQYRDIRTSGKEPSISYPMLKNIGIYGCRGFADVMADMAPAAPPPPAGRTGHCPGAPTGPTSWSSARLDSLYTTGTVLTPSPAALHMPGGCEQCAVRPRQAQPGPGWQACLHPSYDCPHFGTGHVHARAPANVCARELKR